MGTKDGSGSHLMGLLCSAASTPWSFAFFCELTRWLMREEGQRLRHRVISPSASADAVRYCCCRSLRRRRDGIGAEARPEKEGGRAGSARRNEAGRLATSPATGRPRESATRRSSDRRLVRCRTTEVGVVVLSVSLKEIYYSRMSGLIVSDRWN